MALKPEGKIGYRLIQTGVIPTSTNESIVVERLVLLWCLSKKKNINLGWIVDSIFFYCKKTDTLLFKVIFC